MNNTGLSKLTITATLIYGCQNRLFGANKSKTAHMQEDSEDKEWYGKQVEYWDVRLNFFNKHIETRDIQ